jgi:hypothetical protein
MVTIVAMVAIFIVVRPKSRWVVRKATFFGRSLSASECFLDECSMESCIAQTDLDVFFAIEVFATIDPGLFAPRLHGEWGSAP